MKKILVIQTASIGDVILATPVVEKLHASFPDAMLDILVKKGNENLFTGHPFLHEVLVWDKSSRSLRNFDKLLHKVWFTQYDLVVNIQRFFLTGLMTAFSRAGMKIGFDKNPLSFLFSKRIPHIISQPMHERDRNLSLISEITDNAPVSPRLYPTAEDFEKVAPFNSGTYYTFSPASLWFTKQYPAVQWSSLIRLIPSDRKIYLLGSKSDRELCDEIITLSGSRSCRNLAGELSFLESAALMKKAKMNFTNDSAPMHLASAVNAPVTAIFCSTIPEYGFGPLSDDSAVLQTDEPLRCKPCGLHGLKQCPEKHFRCATTLKAEKLYERC
ncbi:MAG: glycosyltransferase family 9 protein [bacterium]